MSEGFPIDEYNRLALDRAKSVSVMSALTDTEGLICCHFNNSLAFSEALGRVPCFPGRNLFTFSHISV